MSRIDELQVLSGQEAILRRGLAERKKEKEVDIGLRGAKDSSDCTLVSGEEFGLSRSAMSTQANVFDRADSILRRPQSVISSCVQGWLLDHPLGQ